MCNTKDGLIESLYFMNTGTPKPSERFYKAQINGGWTCEKRFFDFADINNMDYLRGFMMFTRTAPRLQNANQINMFVFFYTTIQQNFHKLQPNS